MNGPKNVLGSFHSPSDKFFKLFNSEKFSDVLFFIDEHHKLYAHSLILSLVSPVFDNLFNKTVKEQKLIPFLGEKYDNLYNFLKFIYTDDVHVIRYDNCFDLLKLAVKYEVADLEQHLIAFICRNTRLRNTLEHFDIFVNMNYRFMIEHYKTAIAEMLKFYLDLEQFLTLDIKSVEQILDISVVYNDVNVYDIIHAIMRWGENKCTEDNDDIRQMFGGAAKKIKFTSMSLAEISSFLNLYPNFFENNEVDAIKRIITKQLDTEMGHGCDFTLEPFTKQQRHNAVYSYLEGEQIFNVIFNTREPIEILGLWIGAIREGRTCQVTLLDGRGEVINRLVTNVMMLNQYEFPIKFRSRLILEPNEQYQIIVHFQQTNCGVAEWTNLGSTDVVGRSNVELVKMSQFIRKIHFENVL